MFLVSYSRVQLYTIYKLNDLQTKQENIWNIQLKNFCTEIFLALKSLCFLHKIAPDLF